MGRRKKGERKSGPPSDEDDDLPAHLQILDVRSKMRGRNPEQSEERNSGECNSEDRKSGGRRSEDRKSGERRSEDRRSGERRSGERRSGERKSGPSDTEDGAAVVTSDMEDGRAVGTARSNRTERKSGPSEDEEEDVVVAPSKGKLGRKQQPSPRPGQLGFAGVEDDGRAQSHFRGISSGAKAALRKKLELEHQRRAYLRGEGANPAEMMAASAAIEAAPPEAPASFVDVGVWLGELSATFAHDVREAARLQCGTADRSLLESLLALAGPRCEGMIAIYADAGEICASIGDGSRYGGWMAHGAGLRHAAFGLDPRCVGHVTSEDTDPLLAELSALWRSSLCVALGPIGLDYTVGDTDQCAAQRGVLTRLLALASAVPEKPLLICCRGGDAAEKDTAAMLQTHLACTQASTQAPTQALVCSSDAGMLWTHLFLARVPAFQVFDGAVTFTKAHAAHELAFDVPLSRLLLASSAPRHLPTQVAGSAGGRRRVCHPGHIFYTAERLVEVKRGNVALQEVIEASRANTRSVFGV